jgi:UDPglucose 6-dehydrogenase
VVVNKSTVPVGTAEQVRLIIEGELHKRGASLTARVASNPEFLKEGAAVADCMSPDRVVIGAPDAETAAVLKELYAPFIRSSDRFIVMDAASAEMSKYAANAMLAARISFMNEIACICEATGADVNMVRLGVGSDSRIGYGFLYAGCGYGGSCFPKDIQALIHIARENGCAPRILEQVEAVNARQKLILAEKAVGHFGPDLTGRIFAVWGLAFKPNTDDCREAPAIAVIQELVRRGARVRAYDPKAMKEARRKYLYDCGEYVDYARDKYSALAGADALLLVTEWKEFRSPDFGEMKRLMKTPVIFDGRNQYKPQTLRKHGFKYVQIGVGQ